MIENYVQSDIFFVAHFFIHETVPFLLNCQRRFSFQLSMRLFAPLVSARLSRFKLNRLAFQFVPVGKKGLVLFTSRVSGQQPTTTPLLGCPLTA